MHTRSSEALSSGFFDTAASAPASVAASEIHRWIVLLFSFVVFVVRMKSNGFGKRLLGRRAGAGTGRLGRAGCQRQLRHAVYTQTRPAAQALGLLKDSGKITFARTYDYAKPDTAWMLQAHRASPGNKFSQKVNPRSFPLLAPLIALLQYCPSSAGHAI